MDKKLNEPPREPEGVIEYVSEISREMNGINKSIENIMEIVTKLEDAFSPICSKTPSTTDAPSESTPNESRCDLAIELLSFKYRLGVLHDRLNSLLNRCEL